jgi:uncharacterized membrane protein
VSRLLSVAYSREIDAAEPRTERGLDRLVAFTDAVVAIAITLVVLPLVDAAASGEVPPATLLHDDGYKLGAAAVSFSVIAALWRTHHVVLERAVTYTGSLLQVNLFWLAAVVFLPVPTALLFSPKADSGSEQVVVAIYAAVLAVAQLAIAVIAVIVRRSCLPKDADRGRFDWLPWATFGITAVTAVLAFVGLGTHALFILLLGLPAEWLWLELARRRRHRAEASR